MTELAEFAVGSILSQRTKKGLVNVTLNGESIQIPVDKAREIVTMLHHAIEAAISDEIMFRFLTEKIGVTDMQAASALLDFRELRQGSRGEVRPQ